MEFTRRGAQMMCRTALAALLPWMVIAASAQTIQFRDIFVHAGIRFVHNNGAFGKKYLPEAMGPGCAFIDYDDDGWPDIVLVNGENWPGHAGASTTLKLYHNNHDGSFTDVTRKAGLEVSMFGFGVAVGDYHNDGLEDLFITALGQNHLFHNNGNSTFSDATKAAARAPVPTQPVPPSRSCHYTVLADPKSKSPARKQGFCRGLKSAARRRFKPTTED